MSKLLQNHDLTRDRTCRYDACSAAGGKVSFEINNDPRSERFRDIVARAFVEILGPRLRYGPWNVSLRSQRTILSVVMTGPEGAYEEWAFALASGDTGPETMYDALRQRLTAAPPRRIPVR
jgi:hypothetical protein